MSNIIELAAARVLERYFDTRIEMRQIASWGSETGEGVTLITVFYKQSATQERGVLVDSFFFRSPFMALNETSIFD